jgi:hypothetical protein
MFLRKRVLFGVVYGLVLMVVTLAGIEFLSSFYAPPWPASALRATEPIKSATVLLPTFLQAVLAGRSSEFMGDAGRRTDDH